MDERILKLIFDVKIAIEEIESYFQTYPKSFPEYQNNLVLKRAIERNLEIVGEWRIRLNWFFVTFGELLSGLRQIHLLSQ